MNTEFKGGDPQYYFLVLIGLAINGAAMTVFQGLALSYMVDNVPTR